MRKQLIALLLASSMLLSGCVNIHPNDDKSETEEMTSQETVEQQIPLRESEGLKFWSIGNNTCYVMDIGTCKDNILVIPETSPKGETVVGVMYGAFVGCPQINYVYFPDTVKSIEGWAFHNCTNLYWVELNNVETIGEFAFYECNLSSIFIPQSVKSIGRAAFSRSSHLSSVRVHPDNQYYRSTRCGLIEIQTKNLILGCTNDGFVFLDAGEGVNAIGDYAFCGNEALLWFDTNGVIEKIGESAFDGCKNVTEIGVHDGVKQIGREAFYGCSALKHMVIPDSVTEIGKGVLQGCTSLKEVYIGTGITEIPSRTFANCTNLTQIEPRDYLKNVKSIGMYAFTDCQSLPEIPLPSGLETIGLKAFWGCSNLKHLEIPEQVTFPDGTSDLFLHCYHLESVKLPANTKRIDDSCFMNCVSLKTIYYNGTVAEWKQLMQNYPWMTRSELRIKCEDGEILIIRSEAENGK